MGMDRRSMRDQVEDMLVAGKNSFEIASELEADLNVVEEIIEDLELGYAEKRIVVIWGADGKEGEAQFLSLTSALEFIKTWEQISTEAGMDLRFEILVPIVGEEQ